MPAVKARNRNSALAAEVTQAHAGAKFGSSFMSGRFDSRSFAPFAATPGFLICVFQRSSAVKALCFRLRSDCCDSTLYYPPFYVLQRMRQFHWRRGNVLLAVRHATAGRADHCTSSTDFSATTRPRPVANAELSLGVVSRSPDDRRGIDAPEAAFNPIRTIHCDVICCPWNLYSPPK